MSIFIQSFQRPRSSVFFYHYYTTQHQENQPKTADLSSAPAQAHFKGKAYRANITKDGHRQRKSFPGTPESLADAIAWREEMERKLFGEFRYSAHNPEQDTSPDT